MPRPNNPAWFNDIAKPAGSSGLGDTVDYLDRLIAGGNPSQRQFLPASSRGQPARQTGDNRKKNTLPLNKKQGDKRPLVSQPSTINIDDESWIADRKKKFPKIGGANIEEVSKEPATNRHKESQSTGPSQSDTPLKSDSKMKQNPPKRKMTLFEKLMEMDRQPS